MLEILAVAAFIVVGVYAYRTGRFPFGSTPWF